MTLDTLTISMPGHEQYRHEYSITAQERTDLVNSAKPGLQRLINAVLPDEVVGDAFRAAVRGLEAAIGAALSVTPKLSVWYRVQGNCENLETTRIQMVGKPEVAPSQGSFSTTVHDIGFAVKYTATIEGEELETLFQECETSDHEDGMCKAVNFVLKLRLNFEITFGPLTFTPVIMKDEVQLVRTTCCEDYDADDFEDVEYAVRHREQGAMIASAKQTQAAKGMGVKAAKGSAKPEKAAVLAKPLKKAKIAKAK